MGGWYIVYAPVEKLSMHYAAFVAVGYWIRCCGAFTFRPELYCCLHYTLYTIGKMQPRKACNDLN